MQKVAINSTNGHYATKSKNLNTPNFKISFKKLFPTFLSSCVSAGLHPKEGRADVAAGSLHQHRHRPLPLCPPPAQHLGARPAAPGLTLHSGLRINWIEGRRKNIFLSKKYLYNCYVLSPDSYKSCQR